MYKKREKSNNTLEKFNAYSMMEDPMTGQKSKNLPLAKQTIDILSVLEEKTQGNLNADEAAMLKNMLYDLRMLYVKEMG